ncbi:MAG: hypothetical protein QXO37_06890 [Candidatus Nitrosocaldaceae archaeon]
MIIRFKDFNIHDKIFYSRFIHKYFDIFIENDKDVVISVYPTNKLSHGITYYANKKYHVDIYLMPSRHRLEQYLIPTNILVISHELFHLFVLLYFDEEKARRYNNYLHLLDQSDSRSNDQYKEIFLKTLDIMQVRSLSLRLHKVSYIEPTKAILAINNMK